MHLAPFAILILLALPAVAAPAGSGGWPGIHAPPPPIGPPPAPRRSAPPATRPVPTPAQGLGLGVTPLGEALARPAPRVDTRRGAAATQRAVDELMDDLGVDRAPVDRGPPAGVRCANWDRNLQACLDPSPRRTDG